MRAIKETKETPEERRARIRRKLEQLKADGTAPDFSDDEITEVTAVSLDMYKRSSSTAIQRVENALKTCASTSSSAPPPDPNPPKRNK